MATPTTPETQATIEQLDKVFKKPGNKKEKLTQLKREIVATTTEDQLAGLMENTRSPVMELVGDIMNISSYTDYKDLYDGMNSLLVIVWNSLSEKNKSKILDTTRAMIVIAMKRNNITLAVEWGRVNLGDASAIWLGDGDKEKFLLNIWLTPETTPKALRIADKYIQKLQKPVQPTSTLNTGGSTNTPEVYTPSDFSNFRNEHGLKFINDIYSHSGTAAGVATEAVVYVWALALTVWAVALLFWGIRKGGWKLWDIAFGKKKKHKKHTNGSSHDDEEEEEHAPKGMGFWKKSLIAVLSLGGLTGLSFVADHYKVGENTWWWNTIRAPATAIKSWYKMYKVLKYVSEQGNEFEANHKKYLKDKANPILKEAFWMTLDDMMSKKDEILARPATNPLIIMLKELGVYDMLKNGTPAWAPPGSHPVAPPGSIPELQRDDVLDPKVKEIRDATIWSIKAIGDSADTDGANTIADRSNRSEVMNMIDVNTANTSKYNKDGLKNGLLKALRKNERINNSWFKTPARYKLVEEILLRGIALEEAAGKINGKKITPLAATAARDVSVADIANFYEKMVTISEDGKKYDTTADWTKRSIDALLSSTGFKVADHKEILKPIMRKALMDICLVKIENIKLAKKNTTTNDIININYPIFQSSSSTSSSWTTIKSYNDLEKALRETQSWGKKPSELQWSIWEISTTTPASLTYDPNSIDSSSLSSDEVNKIIPLIKYLSENFS